MKSRILSAMLGTGMALSPIRADAQASLDPAVKIGTFTEVAVLEDSAETWNKVLDIKDEGRPGSPVSFGLKTNRFRVNSGKAPKFNREYQRGDMIYCVIDRDPEPDRDPYCENLPRTGGVSLPGWITNGYFSIFLEAKSTGTEVARIDEYLRLPKPTGTRRFTRGAQEAASTGTQSTERRAPPVTPREENRRTVTGERIFDDESDREIGRRVTVSGSFDTSEDIEAAAEPQERTALTVPKDGINFSGRFRNSPENSLRTTDAENDDSPQAVSLDDAVTGELALGYDTREGSVGLFGSINSVENERLVLRDFWFGIASSVDVNHWEKNEIHVRGNVGPYFHRMRHSVGDVYSVEQRNRRVAAALGGSVEMPRLILNTDVFSIGLFNELFVKQLNDLRIKNDENDINYGGQTTFVNRAGPKFSFMAGKLKADFSTGLEYTRLPTIRPSTERIPGMPLEQPPLADYQKLSNEAKRSSFSGYQLIASLDLIAGDLMTGIFYSRPFSGDVGRNAVGVFFGYDNNLKVGYEFSDDSVEIAGERRRENTSHSGILQFGTDFDRLLLPNSSIAPSPTLR